MIESIDITSNPVTRWERFAQSFAYGDGIGEFSEVRIVKRTQGRFWLAEMTISDDPAILQSFFMNGLCRAVTMYSSRGVNVWEGYINAMTLNGVYPVPLRISVDDVANKSIVRYKDASDTFQRSTEASDAASIARYGVKYYVVSGGSLQSSTLADSVARQVVDKRRRPKIRVPNLRLGEGLVLAQRPTLKLELNGWVHTLGWQLYNQTVSTGTQSASLQIATVLAAACPFIASMDLDFNSYGVTKVHDADQTPLDIIFNITSLGDVYDQPWRFGVRKGREAFYRPRAPMTFISYG